MSRRQQIGSVWSANNTGSGTSLALPSRDIQRGSLVVLGARYESADADMTVTDTAGGIWRAFRKFNSCNAAIAYCWNHPGGAGIVITAAYGATESFRYLAAVELTGPDVSDPLDLGGNVVRGTGSSAPLDLWVPSSPNADTFAVQASFSLSNPTAVAPAVTLDTNSYHCFSAIYGQAATVRHHRHSGGSGNSAYVAIAIKPPLKERVTWRSPVSMSAPADTAPIYLEDALHRPAMMAILAH